MTPIHALHSKWSLVPAISAPLLCWLDRHRD